MQPAGDGRGMGLFLIEDDGNLRRIGEGFFQVAW
jgi:hypothetical protein